MVKVSKKIEMIKKIKKFINDNNLDGYIVPKNDNFFTEYSKTNNLVKISNFSGSAGFAIILKNFNYLFVDGRYTLQAKKQSGKNFNILEIPFKWPKDLSLIRDKKIGFDPKLFTEAILSKYFENSVILIPKEYKFIKKKTKKIEKFFYLKNSVSGEESILKISKIKKYLYKNNIDYLYISAGENVNWLLNIRGKDLPNSPLANCKAILTSKGKIYFFSNLNKIKNLKRTKLKNIIFCNDNKFFEIVYSLKKKNFCIDQNTCSVFEEQIIKSKFNIILKSDPIYLAKSMKNKVEIKNTLKAHIEDGVAVTKFLHWFKTNKKEITEKKIEKKIEKFRKRSNNYLYPSFDTIAGSGHNAAIIHYKSSKKTNRKLKKNDILLLDSGGQYKWGTTDVTRTTCAGRVSHELKNNFTRVLKGHIAVVTCNLNKNYNGYLIDKLARKFLKNVGLDYSHGTGHGVGFFLNVHEGPQAISKYNKVILKKGMILSNEPGYYLNNKYGIRIENLIYIENFKNNLVFKNLTYVPIDLDMVNFNMLTINEKKYLFDYHLNVYAAIHKYLNETERKWLINLIK